MYLYRQVQKKKTHIVFHYTYKSGVLTKYSLSLPSDYKILKAGRRPVAHMPSKLFSISHVVSSFGAWNTSKWQLSPVPSVWCMYAAKFCDVYLQVTNTCYWVKQNQYPPWITFTQKGVDINACPIILHRMAKHSGDICLWRAVKPFLNDYSWIAEFTMLAWPWEQPCQFSPLLLISPFSPHSHASSTCPWHLSLIPALVETYLP